MELQGLFYKREYSSAQDGYIRLFTFTAPSSGGTIMISRGHNNKYTSGNPNTTADITIFRWGYYPIDNQSMIILRQMIPYGNTTFGNDGFRLFIGYEVDESGKKTYGIYTNFIDTYELYLFPSDSGYNIRLNLNYNPIEILDKSAVTKYMSENYTDRLLKMTHGYAYLTSFPNTVVYDRTNITFNAIIRNLGKSKFGISCPASVGYPEWVKDADGNTLTYDNGYDISGVNQPLQIKISTYSRDIRKTGCGTYVVQLYDMDDGVSLLDVHITISYSSDNQDKRPTINLVVGQMYFDTTLGKPIYWNGTDWVDATGTPV